MSTFRYRTRLYDPGTGTLVGPGPIPKTLEAGSPLNDVASISVTFNDPQNIVRAPAELAVEVSFDDGSTWTEPPNMRFSILGDNRDRIKSPKYPTLKGVGMFWQLRKAVIHATGTLDADGRRAWSSITPGALIRTLVQEAQTRGVLPWLDVSTFSSTTDSNGTAWPTTFSTSHEIGIGYDATIIALADAGLIDFVMVGRSLRVYVADTYLAPANNGVTLIEGKDFTEATEEVTYELVASRNLIKGDGVSTVVTDAAASKPWGEWEVVTSASGSSNLSDLNTLADLGSARSSLPQTQRTFTVYPNASSASPKPWFDYKLGDKINAQTAGVLETDLRIRQLTLRGDGNSAVITLVLGDRLLEREVRLNRLLKATSGGISGAGGGGAVPPNGGAPGGDGPDNTTPNPVTGLGLSSTAVLINDAIVADLTLTWTAPTTNTDATIFDDFDHYEIQTKRSALGANYWEAGGTTTATVLTVGGLVPGASYDARVRVWDKSGNASAWTTATMTTQMDGTAPNKPSTPTVVADMGLLLVTWNGKDEFGNDPPADFKELQVHVSTTSAFTPSASTIVDSITNRTGGRIPIADVVYGTTYFVKTVAVDFAGNASTPSTQASGIPARVTGLDIADLTIQTTNMGDLIVTSGKMADLAVINAKIANLAVDDAKIANVSVGKLTVGTLSADITVSARIKTANAGARVELNSSGLQAFNASNVQTVNISASTGNASILGTFKTGTSGQRIEIDSTGNGTIYFYPSVGTDYAFINAPNQNSVGVNSGYVGNGGKGTRFYATPTLAEMTYITQPGQAMVGGRVAVSADNVFLEHVSGAGITVDANVYASGGSMTAISTSGIALYGAPNNRYLQFDPGGGTTLSAGGGYMSITNSADTIDINSGGGTVYLNSSGGSVNVLRGSGQTLTHNSGGSEFKNGTSSVYLTGSTVELWGVVKIPSGVTTGNSPNMYMSPSTGQIYYNNSSRTIKTKIRNLDDDEILRGLRALKPRQFYDRADWAEHKKTGRPIHPMVGLISEEVAEIGGDFAELFLTQTYDAEWNPLPAGVDYTRLAVYLVTWMKNIEKRLDRMESKVLQ